MYICNKSLKLGTKTYNPGDTIPDEAVLGSRKRALISSGYISNISEMDEIKTGIDAAELIETGGAAGHIMVPIVADDDNSSDLAEMMAVPLSEADAQHVFSIMQMGVPEAEKAIAKVENENILIVLHACDSRVGVKKAAQKKADTLISTKDIKKAPASGNTVSGISTTEDSM